MYAAAVPSPVYLYGQTPIPRRCRGALIAVLGAWLTGAAVPTPGTAQSTPAARSGVAPPDTLVVTLATVRRLTFERNPSFLAARQETAVAQGGLRQARLYQFNPTSALTVPGAGPASAGGTTPTQLTLTQEVEFAGQRGLRIGAAEIGVTRATASVANAGRMTLADASTAFYRALAFQRRLDVARTVLALNERLVAAVRTQLREGEVSVLDANLAEVELGRARGRVLTARREATSATFGLTRLLGLLPSAAVRLVDDDVGSVVPLAAGPTHGSSTTGSATTGGATLVTTPRTIGGGVTAAGGRNELVAVAPSDTIPPALDADSLVMLALARRPDLGASDAAIREAESLRALARRQVVPNLLLGVAIERSRGYGQSATRVGPAIGLGLPLFNRNQGLIAQRAAEAERARFERQAVALQVGTEVADALSTYQTATTEVAVFATTVLEPARRNSVLLETAFRAGKIALPSLLLLRNQLLEAELGYWDAWLAQHAARVQLDAATGALLPAADQRTPARATSAGAGSPSPSPGQSPR